MRTRIEGQSGQMHSPPWHLRGATHVPQVAPQPSSPQVLPPHSGTQTQLPLWQTALPAHGPQEPPQPSVPQVRSTQFGVQPGGEAVGRQLPP